MADELKALETKLRGARLARAFIDQASALLGSTQDHVKFSCANPPYAGVFVLTLPRSVWEPALQAQVDAANVTLRAATDAA